VKARLYELYHVKVGLQRMRMEGKTGNKRIVDKKKKQETSKIKMLPCGCTRLKGEEDAAGERD